MDISTFFIFTGLLILVPPYLLIMLGEQDSLNEAAWHLSRLSFRLSRWQVLAIQVWLFLGCLAIWTGTIMAFIEALT